MERRINVSSDLTSLSELFLIAQTPRQEEIILDFSNLNIVEPELVLYVAMLSNECLKNGKNILYIYPNYNSAKEYIESIGLLGFVNDIINLPNDYYPDNYTLGLGIKKVPDEEKEFFTRKISEFFASTNNDAGLVNKDFSFLQTLYHELITNVYDHAVSTVGAFAFAEYFPPNERLMLAVSDLGIGLAEKVNQSLVNRGETRKDPAGAITKAFERRFSSQTTPGNRGQGLDTLLTTLNFLDGRISVFTSEAKFIYERDINTFLHDSEIPNLRGTALVMDIRTPDLNPIQNEDERFGF